MNRTDLIASFIADLDTDADSLADAVANLSITDGFEMLADEIGVLIKETRLTFDGETVTVRDIVDCGLTDADLKAMWEGGLLTADPTEGDYTRTIRFASLARLGARKAA